MQIVRTVIWVLLLVALLLFSVANWEPVVTVRIWQNLVVDTKIPAIVVVSFLIGFVPMWLYHRASEWQMKRRIASLENTARTASTTPVATRSSDEDEAVAVDDDTNASNAVTTPAPSLSSDREAEGTVDVDDPSRRGTL